MEIPRNKDGKVTAMALVRAFFMPGESAVKVMEEFKKLTDKDKQQLATAIATQEGVPSADLGFETLVY